MVYQTKLSNASQRFGSDYPTRVFQRGIPTVKLKIPGKAFLKSESTFFHGSALAKSQPLPLVDI